MLFYIHTSFQHSYKTDLRTSTVVISGCTDYNIISCDSNRYPFNFVDSLSIQRTESVFYKYRSRVIK